LTRDNVQVAFADRVGRLGTRWASVDAYLEYFCATTGVLLDPQDPLLRHYLEHDLREGLVRLSPGALLADGRDTYFGDVAWQDVGVPVRWSHAEWSIGADSPPMYPADAVDRYAPQCTTVVALDGLDHAGAIMTPHGAQVTAAMLREAIG
jgi:hypothetical protein